MLILLMLFAPFPTTEAGNRILLRYALDAHGHIGSCPANELLGTLLLDLDRPRKALKYFLQTLERTPGRPMAIYGAARTAEASGNNASAQQYYRDFLSMWKSADPGLHEVTTANEYLAKVSAAAKCDSRQLLCNRSCHKIVLVLFMGEDAINNRLIMLETTDFQAFPEDMRTAFSRITSDRILGKYSSTMTV